MVDGGVLGYGHNKGVDKPTMTTSHLSDKFKLVSSAFVCLLQQIINKTIVLHLMVGFIVEYTLQQSDYLVTKSSDQIFFCRPISILGNKIFYLLPNINLRRQNLYFVATFQNIDYIRRRITFFVA
jgi:hypothetical protein